MTRLLRSAVFLLSLAGTGASVWGQTPAASQKPEGSGSAAPAVSEKQKKLIEDSELLVKLTAELKVSVDKTTKSELSMDVVRRAEAVEKLAKSLKERLREAH